MERKEFHLNEVIFKASVYENWMYSIVEGSVDIYSAYDTDKAKKLVTLSEGQFFGEIGMISVMPRTATAVAVSDNVVLEKITNENFADYLKNHPEHVQPIMASISCRIRELTEDLEDVTKLTNEALKERGMGAAKPGFMAAVSQKLLGNLKTTMASNKELAIVRKRQKALAEANPTVVRYAAGDVLFRAGDEADCMYDIYDGVVGIYSGYKTENEKLLTKLHVDDVFGEMGVLDNMPRSATAVCLSDCALLVVKAESFMKFFQDKPTKILQILQQMCVQLRDLTKLYLRVYKALEDLPPVEEKDDDEDAIILARLEQNLHMRMSESMYDITFSRDCWHNPF
ncbi:MAG: cyclic nucleotide-binding domain-containing protein [Oscillospiraceae bacterium]|nr:cyclic nucleotide-binding domain-containing protein [Oscillospiraceae bacterium]